MRDLSGQNYLVHEVGILMCPICEQYLVVRCVWLSNDGVGEGVQRPPIFFFVVGWLHSFERGRGVHTRVFLGEGRVVLC